MTDSESQPSTFSITTKAAPVVDMQGDPAINVVAAADGYVTFGQPPKDPSVAANKRRFVQASTPICFIVNAGDQAWYAVA
ncbi:hypothetical protein B7W85_12970 [Allorhizobium ampelinum]|nr:hypothetical protein B7W85_12970 [Allorhizobium ampelinum]